MLAVERRIEDVNETKEARHPQARQAATQPSSRRQLWGAAHLREPDADGQDKRVERVRLLTDHGTPKAHFADEMNIADEVKQQVADTGRGKGGEEHAKPPMAAEAANKGGVEEMVDEQFFVIEIVAIPEFRERR